MIFSNWFQSIHDSFNLDELKLLCTELGIDFEDLPGQTKNGKIRSLLLYCQRHQQGDDLLTYCKKERPITTWPDTFQAAPIGVAPPFWQRHWFIGLMIGMMLSIVLSFTIIAVSSIVSEEKLTELLFSTPTPTILPEQPGETLIIVATFGTPQNTVSPELESQIKFSIDTEAKENGFGSLRVEIVPNILKYHNEEMGRKLGEEYDASIVIWGNQTSESVFYSFLNRRTELLDEITEQRVPIPPDSTQFVTEYFPNEIKNFSMFIIGQSYLASQNYDQAIKMHEAIANSLPGDSAFDKTIDVYYALGWLYQGPKREYTKAIDYLTDALAIDEEYINGYFLRGIAKRKLKDWDGAIEDYTIVTQLDPDFPNAYANIGAVYYQKGDLENAIAYYNEAEALTQKLDFVYGGRGRVHEELGNLDEAIADYRKFIELNDNPEMQQEFEERIKRIESEQNQ